MSSTFYDALSAQYNYVNSILGIADDSTVFTDAASKINTTKANLAAAVDDLNEAKVEQANLLTQQENVQRILDREKARLDYKQNSVDTIVAGQKRLAELNRSYTEKYRAYNRIMFYIFVFIILFVIVIFLSYYVPEGVTTILYVVLISAFMIYLFWAYYDIWRRDNLNFDKLGSQSGLLLTNGQASSSSKRYNSITGDMQSVALGSLGYCVGKDCCSEGTYFDISSGSCLVGTDASGEFDIGGSGVSAFTTIDQAYTSREISRNTDNINPLPVSDKSGLGYAVIENFVEGARNPATARRLAQINRM